MSAQSTYTPIATLSGNGTSTSALVFSSIPQTYTDLVLVCYGLQTSGGSLIVDNFNGDNDSPTTKSNTYLYGNGSSAYSSRVTSAISFPLMPGFSTGSSTIPQVATVHFMNYSNSTTYKSMISRVANDQNGSGTTFLAVNLYQNTSPITSFQVSTGTSSYWTSVSQFTLYGIKAA